MTSSSDHDNGNFVYDNKAMSLGLKCLGLLTNGNSKLDILASPTTSSGYTSAVTTPGSVPESPSSDSLPLPHTPRGSLEDLSEYTDADESVSSAPTEFLAEFLSAVMLKEYDKALKYCKLILQYEPNNATAKEFYPLIVEKLKILAQEEEEDEGNSSSGEDNSSSSSGDSGGSVNSSGTESEGKGGSDEDGTTASYSSLEDEEVDDNGTKDDNGNAAMTVSHGFQTSSDSESPTEPISQLLSQLRAKIVPKSK